MIWSKIGEKYTDTGNQRMAVLSEIAKMQWIDPKEKIHRAPTMQGLALKEIIKALSGSHVKLSWNSLICEVVRPATVFGLSLLGVETVYKDGPTVRSYWLDDGEGVTCLCHEVV